MILKSPDTQEALARKRGELAVVLARHPDKDAVQTAGAMNDKIGNGPAFFETWLANADEIEPPEAEFYCSKCDSHWSPADRCRRLGLDSEPGDECHGSVLNRVS